MAMIEGIEPALKMEDEGPWSLARSCSTDVVSALLCALGTRRPYEPQEAAWPARVAYESPDHNVITSGKMGVKREGAEIRIVSHPLIQRELGRQQDTLQHLQVRVETATASYGRPMDQRWPERTLNSETMLHAGRCRQPSGGSVSEDQAFRCPHCDKTSAQSVGDRLIGIYVCPSCRVVSQQLHPGQPNVLEGTLRDGAAFVQAFSSLLEEVLSAPEAWPNLDVSYLGLRVADRALLGALRVLFRPEAEPSNPTLKVRTPSIVAGRLTCAPRDATNFLEGLVQGRLEVDGAELLVRGQLQWQTEFTRPLQWSLAYSEWPAAGVRLDGGHQLNTVLGNNVEQRASRELLDGDPVAASFEDLCLGGLSIRWGFNGGRPQAWFGAELAARVARLNHQGFPRSVTLEAPNEVWLRRHKLVVTGSDRAGGRFVKRVALANLGPTRLAGPRVQADMILPDWAPGDFSIAFSPDGSLSSLPDLDLTSYNFRMRWAEPPDLLRRLLTSVFGNQRTPEQLWLDQSTPATRKRPLGTASGNDFEVIVYTALAARGYPTYWVGLWGTEGIDFLVFDVAPEVGKPRVMCIEATVGPPARDIGKLVQMVNRLRSEFPEAVLTPAIASPEPITQPDLTSCSDASVAVLDGPFLQALVDPTARPDPIWWKVPSRLGR